jgi:hypothetical protein
MIQEIGASAGKIYNALEAHGELTVTKLKTLAEADLFKLYAAIGWLAREDKIDLIAEGKSIKVRLR